MIVAWYAGRMLWNKSNLLTVTCVGWEEWQAAYDSAVSRHFFISPHWGQVVQATYGLEPDLMLFRFLSHEILLLSFVESRLRSEQLGLQSMSLCHYGGVFSDHPFNPMVIILQEELLHFT